MNSAKPLLSVTLATYNEADNIARCLKSVEKIADEIVIVDGQSSDQTVKIARQFNARVIIRPNQANFHINKQAANDLAQGKWILQLDADEVVSPDLAHEIAQVIRMSDQELDKRKLPADKQRLFARHQQLIQKRDGQIGQQTGPIVAFFIPRSNWFLTRFLRHTGAYPDGVIRLFRKDKAFLPAADVHEQYQVNGRVSWLQHDLWHYDSPTFERYLMRNNRYSSMIARQLEKQGVTASYWHHVKYFLLKPTAVFASLYFRHKGFRDGLPGLIFSYYSALTWTAAYIKLYEQQSPASKQLDQAVSDIIKQAESQD